MRMRTRAIVAAVAQLGCASCVLPARSYGAYRMLIFNMPRPTVRAL
jgi:hypothetical protein